MTAHADELIAGARDGDLTYNERRALDEHLARCPQCTRLMRQLESNDVLLSRHEPSIDVEPFEDLGPRRALLPVAFTATALAAVILVFVSALAVRLPVAAPQETTAPSVTARPTPSSGPVASAPAFVGEPESVTHVRANALGTLTGNWIFVGKVVPTQVTHQAEVQVWAVPLPSGQAREALSFLVNTASADGVISYTPYLRRAFSPDGTQVAVSVQGDLVIVDLPTGQAHRLGVEGDQPAWSKDGSEIAYRTNVSGTRGITPDWNLSVVRADGTDAHGVSACTTSCDAEWSPDGRTLLVARSYRSGAGQPQQSDIVLLDSSTGKLVRQLEGSGASGGLSFAHWRATSPEIALSRVRGSQTEVVLLESATASARTVAQRAFTPDTSPCQCPDVALPHDPRWSPASSDEVLYSVATSKSNAHETHILNVRTAVDTKVAIDAYDATWTADGTGVAYLTSGNASSPGLALHLWNRASHEDRELLAGSGTGPFFFAVASLLY